MLTGRCAFSGESVSDILASVLKAEPDWNALPAATPPAMRRLLRQCLVKDSKHRLQAIADARIALEDASETVSGPVAPALLGVQRRGWLPWAVAGVLAVGCLGAGWVVFRLQSATQLPIRSSVLPPEGAQFYLGGNPGTPIFSPDGSRIAFTAVRQAQTLLWVRDLDSLEARPLAGTEGAVYPFWSADSKWLGYFTQNPGKLCKIEVSGGAPVALVDGRNGKGGSWSSDGVIIFTPNHNQPIFKVPASGGQAVQVTRLDTAQGENSHRQPEFLPDGRHFLFLARGNNVSGVAGRGGAIKIGSLDGQPPRLLMPAESQAIYASGKLLFVQSGRLMARPFDPDKLAFSGDAVPIAPEVRELEDIFRGVFSASQTGNLIYLAGKSPSYGLYWLDRTGHQGDPVLVLSNFASDSIELARDAGRVAIVETTGRTTQAISIVDLSRGVATRLTSGLAACNHPLWSPDGSGMVFSSDRNGHYDLYWKPVSEASAEQLLYESDQDKSAVAWSRDGSRVAYYLAPPHPDAGYWVLPLEGRNPPKAGKPVRLARGISDTLGNGAFSADSRWFAYSLRESSAEQVYITDVAGQGRIQVSSSGGTSPRWRGPGKELFYLAADGKMMAVPIESRGDGLNIGAPKPLFDAPQSPGDIAYDVTPDGKRFLFEMTGKSGRPMALTLVIHWTSGQQK
jgi:Tol biopolymer transport system component